MRYMTAMIPVVNLLLLPTMILAAADQTEDIRQEQTKVRQQEQINELRKQEQIENLKRDQQ